MQSCRYQNLEEAHFSVHYLPYLLTQLTRVAKNFVIILFTSELPKQVEEPEVVESEVTIEITGPEEPEPVPPEWVQVYDDLVSEFLVYRPHQKEQRNNSSLDDSV